MRAPPESPFAVSRAPHGYPGECECDALLADGTVITVRPIRPDDAGRLEEFHEHLSRETVYKRFFNAHPHLRASEIERFTCVDYRDRMALVAESGGRLKGVARYDRQRGEPSAEVAFVVADDLQGHGLGTLLLEHLAAAGRHRGVETFIADTLSTNDQMQKVFRQTGFDSRAEWDCGTVHVTFPIAPTQNYLDAVMRRYFSSNRARMASDGGVDSSSELLAVCGSGQAVDALWSAAQALGVTVSTVVSCDPAATVAGLAAEQVGRPLLVDLGELVSPRRFVAVARPAARGLAVVGFDPHRAWDHACDQAGIANAATWTEAIDLARRGGPHRSDRGHILGPADCEVAQARALLDELTPRPDRPHDRLTLDPYLTRKILDAYRIPSQLPLAVNVSSACGALSVTTRGKEGSINRRYVPLTDRDAEDLAGAWSDTVGRIACLVDDQPDLASVSVFPDQPAQAKLGPARGCADDPFVRQHQHH